MTTSRWVYLGPRKEGEFYWVALKAADGSVIIDVAVSDLTATNGWTNHDTWEDCDRAVFAWMHIHKPVRTPKPPRP